MGEQPTVDRSPRGGTKVKRWISSGVLAAAALVLAILFYQSVLLSLVLFAAAVFFLLKDGRKIVEAWSELTPLGPASDQAIRHEFGTIFSSVVWGTVAAPLAQALAFAIGFSFSTRCSASGRGLDIHPYPDELSARAPFLGRWRYGRRPPCVVPDGGSRRASASRSMAAWSSRRSIP